MLGQKIQKKEKRILIMTIIMLALSAILQGLARSTEGFATWYGRTVYPLLVTSIGRFFGLFPFSVVEFGLYVLIVWVIVYTVTHIRKPGILIPRIFLLIGILVFVYTCNCGVNYHAASFSALSDIPVQKSSTDELFALCEYLIKQAKANETTASYKDNRYEWRAEGVTAMKTLGQQYPSLSGYYPMPKEIVVSRILSVQQLGGIYAPFTIEANFNGEMPDYNIPHTICHELSHLRGFMREDEANFIGYLACIGSGNQAFRYSGYLTGWVYAGNALAKADSQRYMELQATMSDQMRQDLTENNQFWRQFDGPVAEVSNQINDTYLKINNQQDGVQSYGRMVDLMLSYYRQESPQG